MGPAILPESEARELEIRSSAADEKAALHTWISAGGIFAFKKADSADADLSKESL
jgi:hypothetical protein